MNKNFIIKKTIKDLFTITVVRFDFKFCQPKKLDHCDPFLGTYLLERDFARHYAVTIDRKNPLLLPLFADFTDLPPFYVQVG